MKNGLYLTLAEVQSDHSLVNYRQFYLPDSGLKNLPNLVVLMEMDGGLPLLWLISIDELP